MSKKFQISIPKPCHEGWSKMTPNEKGRFCNSCAKTVVDFTKKSIPEIKKFIIANKNKSVCGHFYKKQLDTITIEIPNEVFKSQLSFQKLFLLALLLAMGTSLMSCKYDNGQKQKIDNVVLIDSIESSQNKIDSIIIPSETKIDSSIKVIMDGMIVMGDMNIGEEIDIMYPDIPFRIVDIPPRFKGSKKLSKKKSKDEFEKQISIFIKNNFNFETSINLGLSSGNYKIYIRFVIDEYGNITDIQSRAPHKYLEKITVRMISKLPQLIPAELKGKPVRMEYILPISFTVE